ncbi:sigma-B regulation protein RsbU (phosphoserine phosphatase) [Ruminococcus sp. YE71]|nr:PP2C family protein-serine/threonine phosphatase [Ruminococcus sp. YE78]SDA09341.1 sigma-B regulation protein RsbU (phosphoserine phosphatase) [Ruminococcus sp. YE78]SFW12549.1 sigma-B regulation protein RsbU (phosphoserine phosphatase) [Ruminococcus sp. YE71]
MKKGMSIKTKTVIATILFMSILTAAIAVIGYKLYHDSLMRNYITYTDTVLEYSYRSSVRHSFGDMIADREMPPDYEVFREELNQIKDSSDIEYLYAIYFEDIDELHSLHYAINAKNQKELSSGKPLSEIYSYMGKPCEEGSFEDDTLKTLQQAVKNRNTENASLEGYSDEYGHMLNGYRVIYDSNDNAVGLICVEIDINRINAEIHKYLLTVILIAVILTTVIILLSTLNTRYYLIGPIVRITKSSDLFLKQLQDNTDPDMLEYEDAHVNTGGELSLLAINVKSLADGVASYMTNLRAVTAEKERIGTELELAKKIQASMLPNIFPPFPERTEFDIYATMTPAKEVGGDFYDFFLIDDNHLGLVMADVSGKGVPAALFMMASKILLKNYAMTGSSPSKVLEQTNAQICKNNEQEMFVTVWFGILEISTGRITAANAGHEYPIIKKTDGDFELFKDKHGFVVGGMDGMKYKDYELILEKGDVLFLYTDGVAEATNVKNELFGTDRLLTALNNSKTADPKVLLENVKSAVDEFAGEAEQFDDLTMLGIILK